VTLETLPGSTLPDYLCRLGYDLHEIEGGERIIGGRIMAILRWRFGLRLTASPPRRGSKPARGGEQGWVRHRLRLGALNGDAGVFRW
jgi:hypothetical protein